jgi:hypothetical protein
MKKNSPVRLKLHRETLGSLTSPAMAEVQGGNNSAAGNCYITIYITCGCPPKLTVSCPVICQATSNAC